MEAISKRPGRAGVIAAIVAGVLVVLWGGYGHHWPWTGINGHTATLWDWLHLLLLPVAFGLLPVIVSRSTRMRPQHKLLSATTIVVFALLVVAGYAIPWSWTGFAGNRLWDWLELLALPLAVALIPVIPGLRVSWNRRHSLLALATAIVFVAVVIGGYLGDWSWTGFRGNTLWDWLHLLLLPLLLPTVIVPALAPAAAARMIVVEDTADESAADSPSPRQRAYATAEELQGDLSPGG